MFSFQVPSTVQKLTLRSLNGATGLDTLSLTTLEISATNGKITGDSLSASSCRIQAANGKIVLTRLRTDSLDVSATNGRLEITGDCSRAALNGVNGKVLFEGTCSGVPDSKIRQRFRETPSLARPCRCVHSCIHDNRKNPPRLQWKNGILHKNIHPLRYFCLHHSGKYRQRKCPAL